MYNMSDIRVYENAVSSAQEKAVLFSKKRVHRIVDINQSNYSASQIQFNLPELSTESAFLCLQESYITIPYMIDATLPAGTSVFTDNTAWQYLLSLKGGDFSVISGVQVSVNDVPVYNVNEDQQNSLFWKALSQFCQDDLQNMTDSMNYAPDNGASVTYIDGYGESNGKVEGKHFEGNAAWSSEEFNSGLQTRVKKSGFRPSSLAVFTDAAKTASKRRRFVERVDTKTIRYHMLLNIPLRFLCHDIFDKMPLVKGMYLKINVNVHTAKSTIALTDAGANAAGVNIAVSSAPRYTTCPYMLTDERVNITTAGELTINSYLVKNNAFGMSGCEFNAVLYSMLPSVEAEYLDAVPQKTIDYTTITTSVLPRVLPSSAFNHMVHNGISKVRGLLIQPQISSAVNGGAVADLTTLAGGKYSPNAFCLSSAPATCMREHTIQDLQIKIGSSYLYDVPVTYTYDMFLSEIRSAGITIDEHSFSGLLSESAWQSNPFIYIDLSRKQNLVDDEAVKSVHVSGRNLSNITTDYTFTLYSAQQLTLSTATGRVILA